MLDYHLHLWPHTQRETSLALDQVAAYCERAATAGVVELALTEHFFRFSQAEDIVRGFWNDTDDSDVLKASMAEYFDFHARADLDAYVTLGLEAKAQGLPVVLGLEVDYYRGRMDQVSALLDQYPFDVLLGSVHWVGAWRFDDLGHGPSLAEWSVRQVDDCWDAYTGALEELAATGSCDVLAHPDLVKVAGHVPGHADEWWDRIAEAAATSEMAAELSSAGWRSPANEQYPAVGLVDRFARRGVPFTTASDAHRLEHVADRADDLRRLLSSAGVDRLRAFRNRKGETVVLEALAAPVDPEGHEGEAR